MSTATTPAERAAKARWMRRRRRLISYGQWQPFADAEPVRQHVLTLRALGVAIKTLSEKTGVTIGSLDHLLYGDVHFPPARQIRTESAEAILSYWPVLNDYPDGALVDSIGSARRMHALAAIGWSVRAIHQHLEFVNVATLERVGSNPKITARLARAIRDFYTWASRGQAEDHGVTPWVAQRGRNRAARLGYLPPAWWDDDAIDDPAAQPEQPEEMGFRELAAYRREEILHLASFGIPEHDIAARLGMSTDYVTTKLRELRTTA
ncbi:hypothetical protein ABZ867_12720 [Streptomyces cinnamoneus]